MKSTDHSPNTNLPQIEDSKLIQQHLANERTFLAWLRTSITMVGLGFLAAGVVFRSSGEFGHIGHILAAVIGVSAILLSGLVTVFAVRNYFTKREHIRGNTYHASDFMIKFSSCCLAFILLGLLLLMIFMLMY
ncbi:YidH family protein [Paenibacillus chartarius]|uniref:YidH family protein n=1 Tax=Paenibacillus chartarius TaxID=747481 RepID=A0ABV6DKU1_9BACL